MKRVLSFPMRFLRGAKEFVDPQLKAGRVPLARTVVVLQLIAALIFVGYTLVKKDIRLPFSSEPYLVDVILPDGAGLDPSKEPTAGVAGAEAGRVTAVRQENGRAIATLRLEPDLEGKIFADATASLRPINILQVLVVNIEPGDPSTGPLAPDQPITADRTDIFVPIEELTATLDADTQAQVRILISEAATALKDREPELRQILDKVADLTDSTKPLAVALDERRARLTRLTDALAVVVGTLGDRGDQLARTVRAGNRTLQVTADREVELTAATRLLAPTLAEAHGALAGARRLALGLNPALDAILPVAGELQPAADEVIDLIPKADSFLSVAEKLVRDGARPVSLFEQGTRGLGNRVTNELVPAIDNFSTTIAALDKFKGGIAQTADLWSGAFSTQANLGAYSQVWFGSAEITPEGLGLPAAAARSRSGGPSRMERMLAKALELTCAESNTAGCLLRFGLPQLPKTPLLAGKLDGGGEG